ncbi:MAG TPA: GNAT family N-acetyltransferase [Anaerolineae bacterium]|nr:GNAT family N-acetyltransferase [Anaerolineae bacterium]HQH37456.1 GNAT family N-acetyltransferase [Anaerolineae bacterium]
MKQSIPSPIRLTRAQIKPAAHVLARAFADEPLWKYFIPDATRRHQKIYYVFRLMVSYGVRYGEGYATSPNLEGVAIWLPSERAKMSLWDQILHGAIPAFFNLGIQTTAHISATDAYIENVHARNAPFPHQYLSVIGVEPAYQGQGYAGALLRPMLARLDAAGQPCYLETHTEPNMQIYQHYGFEVCDAGTFPNSDTRYMAMVRQPQTVQPQ